MDLRELKKLRKFIKKKYSQGMDKLTKESLKKLNELIRNKELFE